MSYPLLFRTGKVWVRRERGLRQLECVTGSVAITHPKLSSCSAGDDLPTQCCGPLYGRALLVKGRRRTLQIPHLPVYRVHVVEAQSIRVGNAWCICLDRVTHCVFPISALQVEMLGLVHQRHKACSPWRWLSLSSASFLS